ncbi:S-layer protein [Lysinibacillus fusiformis ZB2]|nr:S-layer protein [Lysinibacillus fusiformis ZB2]
MAKQNKGRKFFAASATAALVASAIVPVASAAQVNDYNKISGYAKEAVQSLVDAGVIQGDTNGNFNPLNTVTRAQAAEIFTKALELEADGDVNFSDVKKGAWYYNSIAAVVANGIFEGVSANEFAPNKSLTRSEAAKVLVDAFGLEGSESLSQFADASQVKPWAKDALETAVANGIFTGSEENGKLNLKPNAAITRQDFAVVFARTLDLAVETVDASIKAINNTTVEVTFDEEVDTDNVTAGNFKIDGLEVKSAAVKQTNKKVVVLTTAAQTADKEYVLSYKDEEIGKFKGIASVIPTAIKLTTPSVQGTIGKEATVSAQVTVPEGQSKAGIPVTFNIAADTNNQLNQKIEVVAYTNEEGIASYSYTRYYKYNDQVTAYASEKSSVYASGKVYWAEGLTLTEVTSGNELANGSKKVYKIKTDAYLTAKTSAGVEYNYVNVAFAENNDVTPDKLVRDVEVIDSGISSDASYTQSKYPSQVTTGGVQTVRVKVNSNGEATFTLTGSNSSVTPIVFVDDTKNATGKYTVTALQASAPTVKFALNHTLGLTVKAEGVQNAAAINAKGTGQGGRTYTVTITDKDGKVAPAGTKAYVTFAENSYSTDKQVRVVSSDDKKSELASKNTRFEIEVTGSKGEAKFKLVGQRDGYATPTVYLENGKEPGLDKNDLQTVGEATYFVDAVVANATLTIKDSKDKEVTTLPTSEVANFVYQSVDQNGFDYYTGNGQYEVSYQVTAHFADITANGQLVKAGTTATFKVPASAGKAVLAVTSQHVNSNVTVQASASQVSLPNQTATLSFTSSKEIPSVHTGYVTAINESSEKITIDSFNPISYDNGSYFNELNQPLSKAQFVAALKTVAVGNKAQVTVTKQADGTYKFNILNLSVAKTPAELLEEAKTALTAKQNEVKALVEATYTPASWTAYTAAYATANAMPETTLAEVQAKTAAIDAAIALLITKSSDQAAEEAATKKLAASKAVLATKVETDYKASTWAAVTAANNLPEVSANQKNAKANAIDAAVAGLLLKAVPSVTVAVNDTAAATGKLTLTFTEATETTNLGLSAIGTISSTTAGETVVGVPTANALEITVSDATSTAVDLDAVTTGKYSFVTTITVTGPNVGEYKVQDVAVTVEFKAGAWVATVVNK